MVVGGSKAIKDCQNVWPAASKFLRVMACQRLVRLSALSTLMKHSGHERSNKLSIAACLAYQYHWSIWKSGITVNVCQTMAHPQAKSWCVHLGWRRLLQNQDAGNELWRAVICILKTSVDGRKRQCQNHRPAKDVIKSGANGYLRLKWNHHVGHPSVADIAVIAIPDARWVSDRWRWLCSNPIIKTPKLKTSSRLRSKRMSAVICQNTVFHRMWNLSPELPKTSVGKIEKVIRDQYAQGLFDLVIF